MLKATCFCSIVVDNVALRSGADPTLKKKSLFQTSMDPRICEKVYSLMLVGRFWPSEGAVFLSPSSTNWLWSRSTPWWKFAWQICGSEEGSGSSVQHLVEVLPGAGLCWCLRAVLSFHRTARARAAAAAAAAADDDDDFAGQNYFFKVFFPVSRQVDVYLNSFIHSFISYCIWPGRDNDNVSLLKWQ